MVAAAIRSTAHNFTGPNHHAIMRASAGDRHHVEHRWALLAAEISGLAILTAGLVGPLTPSEGCPRRWELVVFGLIPVLIIARGIGLGSRIIRGFLAVQIAVMLAGLAWLMARIGCLG